MILQRLRIENLRSIERLDFRPAPGINVLTGGNGAGKTSVLEAIFLLSHAFSFRGGRDDVLVRNGASGLSAYGEIVREDGRVIRLGLARASGRWRAKIDTRDAATLAAMLRECAVVCFEPGSHALISGASEERRRFVDWGVFHVEHDFPDAARRYRAALRQRNSTLREGGSDAELDAWDRELVSAAQPLADARTRYLRRLGPEVQRLLSIYVPELGLSCLELRSGWDEYPDLLAALRGQRSRDRARGHTSRGPHRGDWSLRFERAPQREQLSRGQEKLCAIACMVAQAELYAADHAEWPIVILDDLSSELDEAHQQAALEPLRRAGQVFISGTTVPPAVTRLGLAASMFHVEQGSLKALL